MQHDRVGDTLHDHVAFARVRAAAAVQQAYAIPRAMADDIA